MTLLKERAAPMVPPVLQAYLQCRQAALTAVTPKTALVVPHDRSLHPVPLSKLPSHGGRGWGRGLIKARFHPHLTSSSEGEGWGANFPPTAVVISWLLLGFLLFPSEAAASFNSWSYREAEAKLGTHVVCISNLHEQLLQWGPNFPGWDRSRQPKVLGRPVKVGANGVVKEIRQVSEGKYQVVVHWDPEDPGEPHWSTVIGPADDNVTVSSLLQPDLTGRWREVGRSATLEFLQGGGFKALDNEGMAVAGRYTLIKDGRIRFEIQREGTTDEVVTLNFSLTGDDLTLTPTDGHGGMEHYRREK